MMKFFSEQAGWYKGNLHTHTTVSDGKYTPEQTMNLYKENGYDFMAMTDHWKLSHEGCWQDMLLLPGIELDTNVGHQGFHIVGVGMTGELKAERGMAPQLLIDAINEAGGKAILAHPAWSLLYPQDMAALKGLAGSEVMNSVSRTPFNGDRADSAVLLDITATLGSLLPFMAADDSHFYKGEQCTNFIWVNAEALTAEAIMKAVGERKFFASQGPRFKQIEIEDNVMRVWCTPCERAVFYSQALWRNERVQNQSGAEYYEYVIGENERFIRCEIIDAQGCKAWSSPVAL